MSYRDRKYHREGTLSCGFGRAWIPGGNGRNLAGGHEAGQPRLAVSGDNAPDLARLLQPASRSDWWRLVAEFLEEYRWEPVDHRHRLPATEPPGTGDERCTGVERTTTTAAFLFPANTPAARADAVVPAPAAFRLKRRTSHSLSWPPTVPIAASANRA